MSRSAARSRSASCSARHLVERHGLVGQHRAALGRHLGEAADDDEALLDLVALEHFEHARADGRDQRRMAVQDAEVAFAARHHDHVGLGREKLALGHDQPEGDLGHRLRPPRPRASWPWRPPPRSCRPCRRPLRQVVVLAGDDALEGLDGVLELHEHARRAGEDLGDVERLADRKRWILRARATTSLSSSDSSSMPRMAMMSCSDL